MQLMKALLKDDLEKYPFESQEGLGFDAKCIIQFSIGKANWFFSELEETEDDIILFGYADLCLGPGCAEWGYASMEELLSLKDMGLVINLNAEGKTIRELCDERGLEYDDFFSKKEDYGIEGDKDDR